MAVNKKQCFILLELCFFLMCNAEIDYFQSSTLSDHDELDPHSFYYDKHTKTETPSYEDNDNHEIGEFKGGDATECYKQLHKCKLAENTDIADELFSRRIINILVSRARLTKDGSYIIGRINLEATNTQFEDLKNFGLGKLTLREVDSILNKIVQTPALDPLENTVTMIDAATLFLKDLLLRTRDVLLQHKLILGGALATLYLYNMLRGTRFNFWIVLTISIQLILVASFFITWWKLIQKEQIKHTARQMEHMKLPIQCQPHKMGLLDKMFSWFYSKSQECEKYYEAMMSEPMLQVTPAQALSHMLANVMFEPVSLSAKTIATFLQHLTENMPWLLSWIIQVAFCLGFFPALILFVILLCGGTLNLGFGPFSMFSIGGPARSSAPRQRESLESKKERQPIEVILNVNAGIVQEPPNVLNAPASSNSLAVSSCPECCERDKKKESSPRKEAIADNKASGDSASMNSPGSSKESGDEETKIGVTEPKIMELGSGDH